MAIMSENTNSEQRLTGDNHATVVAYPRSKPDHASSGSIVRYLQILFINKWIFAGVLALVLLVFVVYALRQPKLYESQYEVFYNESIREFIADSDVPVIKSDFDKYFWLSTMKSGEIIRQTVRFLGLSYTVEEMKEMINVEMVDKKKEDRVPAYKIFISSPHEQDKPLIIKAYIKALNELLLQNQISNSEKLVVYLRNQLDENSKKLSEIDKLVLSNNTSNPSQLFDVSKLTSDLGSFRTDLLNARISFSSIKASRVRAEFELKNLDGTIVNESAFTEPLKVQLMNLEVDLARALTKNREDHPTIKAIRNNIRQINTMLRDSIEQRLEIKSLMQNPMKNQLMSKLSELKISEVAEETRVLSLEKVISELEVKMLPNAVDEDQQQLLRNREIVFITIKQLNSKLIESQSAAQGGISRFVLIDDPVKSVATNKNLLFYIITGLILGTVLAGVIVYVYDLLDNRLTLIADYEKFYNIPLLGTTVHYGPNEEYSRKNRAGIFDNIKISRDLDDFILAVRNVIRKNDKKTFAIYSSIRREGKSLISLQMALGLAEKNMNVLLVDIDFYSPKLTRLFDRKQSRGLTDYFYDKCSINEILCNSEYNNLTFVTVGTMKLQESSIYDTSRFSDFVEQVKEQYDVVIFDTPAMLYVPDTVNLAEMIDGLIIIARLGYTTRNSLDRLLKMLTGYQSKIVGTVLNDMKSNPVSKYSNYYQYDYYVEADGVAQVASNRNITDNGVYPNNHTRRNWLMRHKWLSICFIGVVSLLSAGIYSYINGFSIKVDNVINKDIISQTDSIKSGVLTDTVNTDTLKIALSSDSLKSIPPITLTPSQQNINSSQYLDSVKIEPGIILTVVSLKYYGHKQFWVYIYLANKDNISDPSNIPIGQTVYIPKPEMYGIDANSPESIAKAASIQSKILKGEL